MPTFQFQPFTLFGSRLCKDVRYCRLSYLNVV